MASDKDLQKEFNAVFNSMIESFDSISKGLKRSQDQLTTVVKYTNYHLQQNTVDA